MRKVEVIEYILVLTECSIEEEIKLNQISMD